MNQPDRTQHYSPILTTATVTHFNNQPQPGQPNNFYQHPLPQQQIIPQLPTVCFPPSGTSANALQIRPVQSISSAVCPGQASMGFKRLLSEIKLRQFDTIRFAAYRTASKLRYIQQRTLFRFIELTRVVDTFREFGLHQLNDPNASLDYAGTARILARIYSQISAPVADGQTKSCSKAYSSFDPNVLRVASEMLLSYLIYALDVCATARLTVNSLKIALSTLTNAKPAEKFRYHFTLLSDPSGALIHGRFETYLQDLLRLPISVFEGPNFFYTPQAAQAILSGRSKNILLEDFLERMLADPGPQLLVWLTIFHRLAAVENIRHNVCCEGCKREPLFGLRYKCTRCQHYNLCQDCFWTGVTTEPHTNAHDVKEYSSATKSHSRQFGHSLRKSFQLSRFTGSGSQSSTNATSSQTVSDRANDVRSNKRPPLGSIFEWNSAPSYFAPTNVTTNGSMQHHTVFNTPIEMGAVGTVQASMALPYRAQLPSNSIRSPLQHRRLHQLNPLLMSHPSHPVGAQAAIKVNPGQQGIQPFPPPGNAPGAVAYPQNQVNPVVTGIREFNNVFATGQPISQYGYAVNMAPDAQQTMQAIPQSKHASLPMAMPPPPSYLGPKIGTGEFPSAAHSEPWNSRIPDRPQLAPVDPTQPPTAVMLTSSGHVGRNLDSKCREEHELIARYATQLAAASAFNTEVGTLGAFVGSPQTQQQLIAELQAKNRKILKEIERLRVEQQKQAAVIAAAGVSKTGSGIEQDDLLERTLSPRSTGQFTSPDGMQTGVENPKLVSELNVLRQRKDDLETRMNNLQRNRRELTLQLETLVRLLSLSGGTGPSSQQIGGLRLLSPDAAASNKPLRSMLPATPLPELRLGHQSRAMATRPDFPPKRSSSLRHNSTDRAGKVTPLTSNSILDAKHEHKRYIRNLSLTSWEDVKATDRSALAAELLRKNLLSPISDLITEASVSRAVFNVDALSRGTAGNSIFLDRFDNRPLTLGISSTYSNVPVNATGVNRLSYSNSLLPSKTDLLAKPTHPTDRLHTSHYQDSGSEAYLYSDPEVGTSSRLTSLTRRGVNHSLRTQKFHGEVLSNDRSPVGDGGAKQFTDNYEYPGLLQTSSVTNGSARSRHDSTNLGEITAASKG